MSQKQTRSTDLYKIYLRKDAALLKQTLYKRSMIHSQLHEQLASPAFHVSLQNLTLYAFKTQNTTCSYKNRAKSARQKISRLCHILHACQISPRTLVYKKSKQRKGRTAAPTASRGQIYRPPPPIHFKFGRCLLGYVPETPANFQRDSSRFCIFLTNLSFTIVKMIKKIEGVKFHEILHLFTPERRAGRTCTPDEFY